MKKVNLLLFVVFASLALLPGVFAITDIDLSDFSPGGSCDPDNGAEDPNPNWRGWESNGDNRYIKIFTKPLATDRESCWYYNESDSSYVTTDSDFACCPDETSCTVHSDSPNDPASASCQPSRDYCVDYNSSKLECDGAGTDFGVAKRTYNLIHDANIRKVSDLTICADATGNYCCSNTDIQCKWADDRGCYLSEITTVNESSWQSDRKGLVCDPKSFECLITSVPLGTCSEGVSEIILKTFAVAIDLSLPEGSRPYENPSTFGPDIFGVGNVNCQDGEVTRLCEDSIKLPFFGVWNFVVSVLGILVLYFVFRRKLEVSI